MSKTPCDKEKHEKIQKNVREISALQEKFGGYRPDLINMHFAAKLDRLTSWLVILTAVLSLLTLANIAILIWDIVARATP
jgi:hypothetical protein